jgi:hypothetical protein
MCRRICDTCFSFENLNTFFCCSETDFYVDYLKFISQKRQIVKIGVTVQQKKTFARVKI